MKTVDAEDDAATLPTPDVRVHDQDTPPTAPIADAVVALVVTLPSSADPPTPDGEALTLKAGSGVPVFSQVMLKPSEAVLPLLSVTVQVPEPALLCPGPRLAP